MRIVPAKPLLPVMPPRGGKAQSSPTITVCMMQRSISLLIYRFNTKSFGSNISGHIPLLYSLQILLAQQLSQNLTDPQYNSVKPRI